MIQANDTKLEPTPQDRLEALRMSLLTKTIESLSDDEADSNALQTAIEERDTLLKQYFSKNFGPNVVPLISRPS